MSDKKVYSNLQKSTQLETLKALLEVAMLHATPNLSDGGYEEINVKLANVEITLYFVHNGIMTLIPHEISQVFKEGDSFRVRLECDNFSHVDFIHQTDGKISMEIQGEGCLVMEIPDVTPYVDYRLLQIEP